MTRPEYQSDEVLTTAQAASVSFPVSGPCQWQECGRAIYAASVDGEGTVHAVGLSHQMLVNGEVAHLSVYSEVGKPPVVTRSVRWPDEQPELVEVDAASYLPDSLLAHW